MILLEEYKSDLQNIIQGLCNTLNLEAAVFDAQSRLIASTQPYLHRKGSTVHAPSIEEVIMNGNILVNKPGYMKSCIGCRFIENCPSTIEILNCIKVDNRPVGVITLTSFTKSGHNRITQHIGVYINIVNQISELISNLITYKHKSSKLTNLQRMLQGTLDLSEDSLIIVDHLGFVHHSNGSALKLFSFCGLYTQSIQQIFPEPITKKILSGKSISREIVGINNISTTISSIPLNENNRFIGAILRIAQDDPLTLKSKKNDSETADSPFSEDNIKGDSQSIQAVKDKIKKIANSTSTVLITGETGTGKGLFAKNIHYQSNRCNFPFISINCASIPETLFESELFGYEEGAFTGARKGGKPGQFELAQHGTLFLDEIGEMPFHIQSKLLKVLQEQTIQRVGGISSIPIDVRIIAATNRNLEEMIERKEFREDLYYRLNVIPINIPPLHCRKTDIEILAKEFLRKYNLKLNKNIHSFSPQVLSIFDTYHWPGNIRELENVIEYAINMEECDIVSLSSLPEKYLPLKPAAFSSIKSKVDTVEFEMIKAALDKYGWDVKGKSAAAKELNIGLRTLYRKLKSYGDMG